MNAIKKAWGWLLRKWQKPVIPPAEQFQVVPIMERFASRPCPEYSRLNEELYCNGMTAEDGTLWILRDHALYGRPVVEVRINDVIYDLRLPRIYDPTANAPTSSMMVHNRVMLWLIHHGRNEEMNDQSYGYWILDAPQFNPPIPAV